MHKDVGITTLFSDSVSGHQGWTRGRIMDQEKRRDLKRRHKRLSQKEQRVQEFLRRVEDRLARAKRELA